jgi:hypothetical protein
MQNQSLLEKQFTSNDIYGLSRHNHMTGDASTGNPQINILKRNPNQNQYRSSLSFLGAQSLDSPIHNTAQFQLDSTPNNYL